jgi:hypothetical protein
MDIGTVREEYRMSGRNSLARKGFAWLYMPMIRRRMVIVKGCNRVLLLRGESRRSLHLSAAASDTHGPLAVTATNAAPPITSERRLMARFLTFLLSACYHLFVPRLELWNRS